MGCHNWRCSARRGRRSQIVDISGIPGLLKSCKPLVSAPADLRAKHAYFYQVFTKFLTSNRNNILLLSVVCGILSNYCTYILLSSSLMIPQRVLHCLLPCQAYMHFQCVSLFRINQQAAIWITHPVNWATADPKQGTPNGMMKHGMPHHTSG